jgi:gliding motility-associated-like protein
MNNVETNAEQMNKTLDVIANDILLNNQRCTIDTIEIISPPRNGSAISESNNTITYTPESYYWGADSLQYRIIDIWGETDTAWAYINVIFQNIPPVAENDNVDLIPGQTFEILILENDYDPDPYPYGYIDTSLTYIVVEQMPQFGQVSIDVNTGIVSYTPVDLTCDDDKFTYVIYDNYGDTASATVTIKAPVEAEIFAYPDTVRTWPTVPVDFNVLENDSGYFIPWVENYTQPFTGNVEQIGDSSFTFYPSSDFIVTDSMMYTLESPCGNTKTGTVIFMIEELRVPEIISPNDDGKNDVLIIDGIEYFPDSWLKIFNRYGHIVYQRKAYDNSWGGYSNRGSLGGNKPLPTGTYYYTLEYNDSKNKQAGIIYIFR